MPTYPKNYPSHFPKPKKEESEFGPGKKDIIICRKCGVVYWYKSWHHRLEDYPQIREKKEIAFTICPACQMIRNGKYEGEIVLENIPKNFRKEVKKLAENFGQRAFEKDPMDRIISIEEKRGKKMRIITTENQLSQRLAKKIKKTFASHVKLFLSHSKKDKMIRARVVFTT